jgi:hypothetical protein
MTTAAELDLRYGRHAPRKWLWVLLGVVSAGLLAVVLWWTVQANLYAVDANDLGYRVIDQHSVEVSFAVTSTHNREIVCVLQALDTTKAIVGWKVVHIPASTEHTRGFAERIPTIAEATTGLVNTCWVS